MKLAVTGKGGVGKTTVAAGLARALAALGERVLAVDADPDMNLAGTLGHRGPAPTPLAAMKELIDERMGGGDGEGWGGFLKLNPRVDDLPDGLALELGGIRLLAMGTVERGRGGCACRANVLLREVLSHLVLDRDEHVIVDMEAGIEHLGRGTAEGVDRMLVVVEPGWASLQTASRIAALAADLGLRRVEVLANKVASEEDRRFLAASLAPGLPLLGELPLDRELELDARAGRDPFARPFGAAIQRIARTLKEMSLGSS